MKEKRTEQSELQFEKQKSCSTRKKKKKKKRGKKEKSFSSMNLSVDEICWPRSSTSHFSFSWSTHSIPYTTRPKHLNAYIIFKAVHIKNSYHIEMLAAARSERACKILNSIQLSSGIRFSDRLCRQNHTLTHTHIQIYTLLAAIAKNNYLIHDFNSK